MSSYDVAAPKENVVLCHQELSPQDCEKTFGIRAGLTAAFQMGEQVFGIFRINTPNCFPRSPRVSITTPYLIVQFSQYMSVKLGNCKGLREGEKVILGRADQSRFNFDQAVSRKHVEVSLINGSVKVADVGSTNGTQDVFDRVASLVRRVDEVSGIRQENIVGDVAFAKQVENHELTRTLDNDGKPLDPEYVANQTKVREFFVDSISDGTLYSDEDGSGFSIKIQKAHEMANRNDVYLRVGAGHLNVESGKFRSEGGGLRNRRESQAREIASIAMKYGDPYSERFVRSGEMKVKLESIPDDFLPVDRNDEYTGYMFFYPTSEAIPAYMKQINSLGNEILHVMKSKNGDTQAIVELIAKQYQYAAIIRPFNQINNSLFMNLANAQLKLIGYRGIPHGNLDLAAQRLQPDAFVRLFLHSVKN